MHRNCLLAACLFVCGAVWLAFAPRLEVIFIAPGDINVPLSGTTAAASPDLAGVVVADPLRPFTIVDSSGNVILTGNVQDRVVRSNNLGTLIFAPRLRDLDNHNTRSFIWGMRLEGFGDFSTDVDFRTDGSGDVGPNDVTRSGGSGDQVFFHYDPNIILPPHEGLFLSVLTDAPSFAEVGWITIVAQDGAGTGLYGTTLIGTNAPVPEPSTLLLAAVALLGVAFCARRRARLRLAAKRSEPTAITRG